MSSSSFQISRSFIQELCSNQYFLQQLQHNLHPPTACNHKVLKIDEPIIDSCQTQTILKVEHMMEEISDLMIKNFQQSVHKQSNQLYSNILTMMADIQSIKNTIGTCFQSKKNDQEGNKDGLSAQKFWGTNWKQYTSKTRSGGADTSIFLDVDSDIQIPNRKNFDMNSLSFINSFCGPNQEQHNKEDELNQKINTSLSKIESSMEEKLSGIEQKFERRIEAVMKTVKNLIALMEENNHFCRSSSPVVQPERMKTMPQQVSEYETPKKLGQMSKDKKSANSASGFLNKSQSKLSAFFKRGS